MAAQNDQYRFEEMGQFTVRTRDQAAPEAAKLMRRLSLDPHDADETITRALQDFVINHHLAIEYYQTKLSKIVWWRRAYLGISMALLLALPVVVVLISRVFDADNLEIFTAIIAGIFAFYRGISAWADMRVVAGALSEASSKLKEAVYTFEQTWDEQSKLPIRPEEFVLAAEAATDDARRTIHNEQNVYFKNLSYPSFDLGSIFDAAGSSAKSFIGDYATKADARQQDHREAVRNLESIDTEINQHQARLGDVLVELAGLPANASKSRRQTLEHEREEALAALRTAELRRAAAMSDLETV